MEQEKTERLSCLGYLLKLLLRAKEEARKERIYAWVIAVSCITIGAIICYILFYEPTLKIEGSIANVNISTWAGDSLEVTADKVARYAYKAAKKKQVKRIVASLSMAHLKASGHPPVDMGIIIIDATEVRKYKDLVSYISNNIDNIKTQISFLEYAKHLGN